MGVGDAQAYPCLLTPVLTQLIIPKPLTTFLTYFCRGERDQTHNQQVMSPTRSPQSQPDGVFDEKLD